MCLTVGGDGEDGAVEDVYGDVCGVGRGGLTRVDARVGVLDVADDEARDGAAAGIVLEAVGGGGPRPGRRRGGGGSGTGVEEDHLRARRESIRTYCWSVWFSRRHSHDHDI